MQQEEHLPKGQILLRTVAMPADANANGDIFGGWIMSQLDLAGAILANEITKGPVVTASVERIDFLSPVGIGDVVCCYGYHSRLGNSSLSIQLELWTKSVKKRPIGQRFKVCHAQFNYVAINEEGHPRVFDKNIDVTDTLHQLK